MEHKKRTPLRRCSVCMEHFDKRDLLRVLRTPEGEVVLDKTLRQNGRGAYVCKNEACRKKLRKSRRLETALKTAIPEQIYQALENFSDGEA